MRNEPINRIMKSEISRGTREKLEWGKVLGKLAAYAASEVGREAARGVLLFSDIESAREGLRETTEARELIEEDLAPILSGAVSLDQALSRAKVQAVLSAEELLRVGDVLHVSRKARALLLDRWEQTPILAQSAMRMHEDMVLEKEVLGAIDRDGNVNDSASQDLAELRARYKKQHQRIHEIMKTLAADPKLADILQDDFFTLRNGRYVLLVKVERQHAVDGIVHDISRTSQSLYIEPKEVTRLNNVLRATQIAVAEEVRRILAGFSLRVFHVAEALERTVQALAAVDLAFARAHYANFLDACPPALGESGTMRLVALRHPLLLEQGIPVVANTVEMDEEVSCLIITGPNTGGKTVLLKAVGLCALMVRAGMHPPVGPDSVAPFFDRVFAEIGDAQSIEAGLSSFAARIAALRDILENQSGLCLVLLDEIGEGTDPRQGVALSTAVLEELVNKGARTVVTTHFSELAAMAVVREGFVNASMEFDEETMRPSYRLRFGVPGRSGAFEVAARIGLHEAVVRRAREIYSGADSELDVIMERLDKTQQELSARLREAQEAKAQALILLEKQRDRLRDLEGRRRSIAQKELAKTEALYRSARRDIQEAAAVVKKRGAGEESRARERIRRVIDETRESTPVSAAKRGPKLVPIDDWEQAHPGQTLHLRSMNADGKLETLPDARGVVRMLVGGMRVSVSKDEVFQPVGSPRSPLKERVRIVAPETPLEGASTRERTLDFRGRRADEAVDLLAEFLDRAWTRRWETVFIIHGHGMGVLRRLVREHLETAPYKLSYRPGERHEGGDGVTVVEMERDE